ncbi:MAG: hypothetical protein EB121_01575 [Alphaproteobacteria bacterium]|nr:hypothetical protein [Alphaproteobacteria bacterium]NDG04033.1 hypothetical protein [Alphaproteobacteria bacterium]
MDEKTQRIFDDADKAIAKVFLETAAAVTDLADNEKFRRLLVLGIKIADMTQHELAKLFKSAQQSAISRWTRGISPPI